MKIAVLSDIHLGLNRKKTGKDLMEIMIHWLATHQPDCFIMAGDLTNKPSQTTENLKMLQNKFLNMKILFVHGNHDIYADHSDDAAQLMKTFKGNLANGPVELNDNWVVIGDGGWYDYSLGLDDFTQEAFQRGRYEEFTWPDKTHANWSVSDIEKTQEYLEKIEAQLIKYRNKNIIMVTHFVPFKNYTLVKNNPAWDFFNAMMGSSAFGVLALKYKVKKYIFGHIHYRFDEHYKGIDILCHPLGYYPHEWTYQTPEEEIEHCFKCIEI